MTVGASCMVSPTSTARRQPYCSGISEEISVAWPASSIMTVAKGTLTCANTARPAADSVAHTTSASRSTARRTSTMRAGPARSPPAPSAPGTAAAAGPTASGTRDCSAASSKRRTRAAASVSSAQGSTAREISFSMPTRTTLGMAVHRRPLSSVAA
jgi:hypothetical protein